MTLSGSASKLLNTPACEGNFVLELHSHRKLSDVALVIDRLLEELRDNGYGFVDSESGYLHQSSRKAWLNWLVNAITFWSCKLDEEDQKSQAVGSYSLVDILDQLSELIALFSGRAASRERVVTFEIRGCKFKINEPSYEDSDLGWKTWPAGVLLASYISKAEPEVGKLTLELGCGTGLVGLASALWNPHSEHYLTDYHENVLRNVRTTLALNGSPVNVKVQKLNWDWFEKDLINGGLDPQLDFWNPLLGSFKVIYAADILYQLRHACSVPRVIKAFLASSKNDTPEALTTQDISKAYVLIPIRSTHLQDTVTFERELVDQGLTLLHTLTLTPPNSSSTVDILNSLNNPISKDKASLLLNSDYTDIAPRDAILAYRLYVCANFLD